MRHLTSAVLIAAYSISIAACSRESTTRDAGGGLDGTGAVGANGTGGAATGGITGSGGAGRSDGAATGGITGSGGAATGGITGSGGAGRSDGAATGGAGSGGAGRADGAVTGGITGSGGAATGGTTGSGDAGTGSETGGPKILWSDDFHITVQPWGLDGAGVEHPIGTSVTPSDDNGVNLSLVPDPLGGTGFALRHFATFDTGGSRSQGGLYGDVNTIFGNQAKKPEGIWVAQEWYFPEAISASGDPYCWINLWDWHSIDSNRGNRWATAPGLMLARDGSMKVVWEWGSGINPNSQYSSIAMPVGRWFDIEMHYVWSETATVTLSLWIDGQLALEQSGVKTKAASHQIVETYLKFYGSTQGGGPWVPTPSLKYTRNVRVAGERIWR